MFGQRPCVKAGQEQDGDACPGPLGGHFSQECHHCSLWPLELTGLPWELQRAAWLLCKQLSDGVGFMNPDEP